MLMSEIFRKLMISHPDLVRKSVLNDTEIKYTKHCQARGQLNVDDFVSEFNVSRQYAGGIFNKLCQSGYLFRHKVPRLGGGFEYQYCARFGAEEVTAA